MTKILNKKFYNETHKINSSIRIFLFFISIMFIVTPSFASNTYYMATTGSNSNAGNSSTPWLTLQYSMAHMSSGDTLIIKDGTYTGSSNVIGNSNYPPTGSSGTWTTIQAENDGGVIFDGENTRTMFYWSAASLTSRYIKFKGLLWCNSTGSDVTLGYAQYIKFINCGAYDAASGNNVNFWFTHCSYVLAEGCYAYGSGRYKFCGYRSSYIIFRNCVGRSDIIDASGEPCAQFSMYSCDYSLCQNCIAIDSDQTSYYSASEYHGPFIVPSTDQDANYTTFENCIGLNIKTGGIAVAANNYASKNTTYKNCVLWDMYDAIDSTNGVNRLQGPGNIINHCTFGAGVQNSGSAGMYFNTWSSYGSSTTLTNNLVYGISGTGWLMYAVNVTRDYNYYYANSTSNNYYNAGGNSTGAHESSSVNFKWASGNTSGGLKYLPRVESGSNISDKASDSGDIGANVTNLIGTSGTLYGETGYDTDTGNSMWPFPNEDLIKTKMAAYTGGKYNGYTVSITGARGFAASGSQLNGTDDITLTSYIWEYLGNQMPEEIYASVKSASSSSDSSDEEETLAVPGSPQGLTVGQ